MSNFFYLFIFYSARINDINFVLSSVFFLVLVFLSRWKINILISQTQKNASIKYLPFGLFVNAATVCLLLCKRIIALVYRKYLFFFVFLFWMIGLAIMCFFTNTVLGPRNNRRTIANIFFFFIRTESPRPELPRGRK